MNLYRHTGDPISKPAALELGAAFWRPTEIGAWAVDLEGPKTEQHRRLQRSPLVPSLIVETASSYQAYFVAKSPNPAHTQAVVDQRLAPHFGARVDELLPAPGIGDARIAWKHHVSYSERQIAKAFRWVRPTQKPRPVQVAAVLDPALERAFVAALIASPHMHSMLPEAVGLDVLADFHAQHAFAALANLRARGVEVTPATIRQELVDKSGHHDHDWLDQFPATVKPPALVLGWAHTILRLSLQRARLVARAEPATQDDTQDDELDALAMKDMEP